MAHKRSFVVPSELYAPSDIGRLLREIEQLQDTYRAAKVREEQQAPVSRLLQLIIDQNKLDSSAAHLKEVADALKQMRQHAPVVHMSFASNPTPDFIAKLVRWFREEVHPYVLVQIGLQPSIAAGCIVRTPNQYFDLTMRKRFSMKRDSLVLQLKGSDEPA